MNAPRMTAGAAVVLLVAAHAALAEEAWTASGLEAPESALYDASRDILYVSNIAGEPDAKDGNGYHFDTGAGRKRPAGAVGHRPERSQGAGDARRHAVRHRHRPAGRDRRRGRRGPRNLSGRRRAVPQRRGGRRRRAGLRVGHADQPDLRPRRGQPCRSGSRTRASRIRTGWRCRTASSSSPPGVPA